MVLLVVLVIGGVFAWQAFIGKMIGKFMAQGASAPQTVSTVVAKKTTWQQQIRAIGSLRAFHGADLSAQASGVVEKIAFDSGNDVPAARCCSSSCRTTIMPSSSSCRRPPNSPTRI